MTALASHIGPPARSHATGGPALISDAYRAMQTEMHRNPGYAVALRHWAPLVAEIARQVRPPRILDYGAGKGRLGEALAPLLDFPCEVRQYDPAIPAIAAAPEPCEMVACLDVLEHIEPDRLDAVLDDLQRVTARIGLFTIATGPASKMLPDGRNAHLIQQDALWWLTHLFSRFAVEQFTVHDKCFSVIVTRH